jgi:hypothetical protein
MFSLFEQNMEFFSKDFYKSPKYHISNKSVLWKTALMHKDRRTDGRSRKKLIGAFRDCANAPKVKFT